MFYAGFDCQTHVYQAWFDLYVLTFHDISFALAQSILNRLILSTEAHIIILFFVISLNNVLWVPLMNRCVSSQQVPAGKDWQWWSNKTSYRVLSLSRRGCYMSSRLSACVDYSKTQNHASSLVSLFGELCSWTTSYLQETVDWLDELIEDFWCVDIQWAWNIQVALICHKAQDASPCCKPEVLLPVLIDRIYYSIYTNVISCQLHWKLLALYYKSKFDPTVTRLNSGFTDVLNHLLD